MEKAKNSNVQIVVLVGRWCKHNFAQEMGLLPIVDIAPAHTDDGEEVEYLVELITLDYTIEAA
jgi:hypothetical protein